MVALAVKDEDAARHVIVTVAVAPGARFPRFTKYWLPGAVGEVPGGELDTNEPLAGRASVAVTLFAMTVPMFFTLMVYANCWLGNAPSGPVCCTESVVVVGELLHPGAGRCPGRTSPWQR